jgi:hypothetical protein
MNQDSSTFSSLDHEIISNALSQSENNVSEQLQNGGEIKTKSRSKYNWDDLDSSWEHLLGTKDESDSHFVVKDCLGDGNCQFRSIEEAINKKFTHKKLRKLVADYILQTVSDQDFKHLLDNYKIEKNNGEFTGQWNPFSVKTKKQFVKHIKKPGFHFQGDNTTISLLSKALKIDFVIFTQNKSNTSINELSNDHDSVAILLYIDNSRYKTIGVKHNDSKKVETLLNRKKLPDIVEKLLNQEYFYQNQIDKYYRECCTGDSFNKDFTLTGLYRHLSVTFKRTITKDDKIIISKILKQVLKNMKAKYHPPKFERRPHNRSVKKSHKRSIKKSSIKKSSVKKSHKRSIKKSSIKKSSVKKSHKRSPRKRVKNPFL